MQGVLKGFYDAGNKIRVCPKNENVKHKLVSKYQKSVSFSTGKICATNQ
jgi:hypothetical protein